MESKPKLVKCPFPFCQQPVVLPPKFNDTLQCACGAEYHYEFGTDLYIEIASAEEDGKEWKYVFAGVAKWITGEERRSKRKPKKRLMKKIIKKGGSWYDLVFRINYNVKEEDLLPHKDKIYLFFTK